MRGDVAVIDQTRLPFEFAIRTLRSVADAERAIRDMLVRGAPLIGVTAAYGVALRCAHDARMRPRTATCDMLIASASHGRQPALGRAAHARAAGALPPSQRAAAA